MLHELDPEALSYVDDIYLTDNEILQHLRRVSRIVVGFADIGYKFNLKKSKIAFLSVIFLGYELSSEGKSLVPHFLEKCALLQPPNTVWKLQSLLGFLNFGRTYIPDYATRIKLLYELIRPNFSSRFWTIEHTHILRELQTDLLALKHLHTRDNKTHLVIRVIPGAVGITYVPFNEGETVPIAYKSHLYSAAEQRFAQTEKILTAVQMAVIKERPLAQGQHIIVVSPIPALEAVTKASVPNSKALHPRWIQWATSLTATDVDYIFDPKLQTQEFLQYEMEYPVPAGTLPIDQYQVVMYTDGSAQPAVGTKQQYSAACAVVADLKDTLPKVHVVHTLGHQRVGIQVAGNTLSDEAAKSAVVVATVAAVTRSSSKPDTEISAAIKATADGTPFPKGLPSKYGYCLSSALNAVVNIPGIGVRELPNKIERPRLISAAHEGVASAHAGVAATISLLQARYCWPGLYKETKQYVLCCNVCQQIKASSARRPQQTPLLISLNLYSVCTWIMVVR
ncbi:hypothetical protein NDU88_007302 [Pleurodeles waltl]|uniref:Gypsy retrotransposon integrase-like protein 1 n=1 Tax=Pleurodeles waltl TaxID=8319 RepID=A0AAV7RRZ7_PLEWA|nr:hypothetical protein NDU88_007302 [Pleurodeles waltl]